MTGIACAPFGTRARSTWPSSFTSLPMPATIFSASATRPFVSESSTLTDSPWRFRFSSSGVPSTTIFPLRDDRDALGEPVGLLEVVRREEDRQALGLGEPLDLDPHRRARLGVESCRRLVEEQHLRLVDETERDVESPLHPAGVAARLPVGGVAQPDELEQLVDARVQRLAGHPVDPALQEEVLAAGRLPVDAGVLRDVAEHAAHARGMRDDVLAADERAARVGLRQRRQHADGRRLPGAVRAEQPEHLALAHRERHAVERLHGLVALVEVLCDDRVHRFESRQEPNRSRPRRVDVREPHAGGVTC